MWHYNHLLDPRSTSPASLMPEYDHLFEEPLELDDIDTKVKIFRGTFDAPYGDYDVENAEILAVVQAGQIADGLVAQGLPDIRDKKAVALIAYLQRLGKDIQSAPAAE
jgi:cytochrome c oxidase cbb3-type subunit I/II